MTLHQKIANLIRLASATTGIPAARLHGKLRRRELVEARWAIWLVMSRSMGLSNLTIAEAFRRDPSSICKGLQAAAFIPAQNVSFHHLLTTLTQEVAA